MAVQIGWHMAGAASPAQAVPLPPTMARTGDLSEKAPSCKSALSQKRPLATASSPHPPFRASSAQLALHCVFLVLALVRVLYRPARAPDPNPTAPHLALCAAPAQLSPAPMPPASPFLASPPHRLPPFFLDPNMRLSFSRCTTCTKLYHLDKNKIGTHPATHKTKQKTKQCLRHTRRSCPKIAPANAHHPQISHCLPANSPFHFQTLPRTHSLVRN